MATRTKNKPAAKKTTAAPGKAVAKRESRAPAKPDLLNAMRQEAGRGTETMKQEDLALPFILVLQSLSPQLQKGHEKHIKGAEAGDLLNTVTGEIWKGEDGALIIPCHYTKVYNEWIPRDDGGGFVASYTDKHEAEMSKEKDHEIVDTGNHFVLVYSEQNEEWQEAVLSMTSTKLKVSRQWNSRMKQRKMDDGDGTRFTPPTYAAIYRLSTTSTQNDKGFFHVPKIEEEAWVDDAAVYEQARDFYTAMAAVGSNLSYRPLEEQGGAVVDDEEDEEAPRDRRF